MCLFLCEWQILSSVSGFCLAFRFLAIEAANNTTFKLSDVKQLVEKKFSEMGVEDWVPFCDHVENIEKEYIEKDKIMDTEDFSFIISLSHSDDESDSSSASSNGSCMSGVELLDC